MNVCQTLICFFFLSALWNTDLINAQDSIHTVTEGRDITVVCSFTLSGRSRLFCKRECGDGDILIKTEKDAAQRGRYSIKYKEGVYPASYTFLIVSIRNLTESDSGRYRCRLDRSLFLIPAYSDFEIKVTDAPTSSDPNWILPPVTAFVPSTSTLTTSQSLSSTSSSSSSEGTKQPQQQHTTPGVDLCVRLTLVVMFIVISTAVVMFYRKRARELTEAPVEPEYVNVTETNRVSEEIREEDRHSRSPPGEMSTIHTFHCSQFSEQD